MHVVDPLGASPCLIQNGRASEAQHATQNVPNARDFPDMGIASSIIYGLMYEQAQGSFYPCPAVVVIPELILYSCQKH